MGAATFIVVVAGMVVPIVLLVATLVFDVVVIAWAAYRLWRDRWSGLVANYFRVHSGGALAGSAGLHGKGGIPKV